MPTCTEGHASDRRGLLRRVRGPDGTTPHSRVTGEGMPRMRGAGHRPLLRSVRTRFGTARTGTARATANAAAPVGWTAVVAADREFHQRVLARQGPETVEFPQFFPERRISLDKDTTLIGRHNHDQGVEPEIDLGIRPVDRGVSTQHAVLRIRDSGLTVTDLGSTNGTSLNDSEDLLAKGEETPLVDGDRIHVGAWTTITVVQGR